MNDPARIPVIVGVGQINDRPETPADGMHSGELMVAALNAADEDAGGGWLAEAQSLGVVRQISFPDLDPLDTYVAERCGMANADHFQSDKPHGDMPIRLLHEAANAIGRGEIAIAAVTGGEALRTAAARARAAAGDGDKSNALGDLAKRARPNYPARYGLRLPTDVYPLYENALRKEWGQSLTEAQQETARMWSAMSKVADGNEAAWLHRPVEPDDILTVDERNVPIAFPYTKLMVANASVNQGAGFIVASLAEARRRGLPEDRLVHIGYGAAAKAPEAYLARPDFSTLPSMELALRETLRLNDVAATDLTHAELYSCFPCVPKLAARFIDWPEDRDITVFGGLTFGGGPIANYMSHAVAEMVHRLRGTGDKGLLYANGGFATDHHAIIVAGSPLPGHRFPQDFDRQAEADAALGPIPELDKEYAGQARIETYTVFYKRDGSVRGGVIVALTPDGKRTLAAVDPTDRATLRLLTGDGTEPVGQSGLLAAEGDLRVWKAGS